MQRLADRIDRVSESGTVRFTPLIARLRKQGREIIDLAVGEPFFKTPAPIIDATCEALSQGWTRYDAVAGRTDLRSHLADVYGEDAGRILICNGSKQALYSIFQVICNPGDDVIIPKPCWASFMQQVLLAGARPVLVDTIAHQLDLPAIEAAVTPRTKAILINSPNNPTGAVYPQKDLARIAELAAARGLYVISDEAYDEFVYDGFAFTSMRQFRSVCASIIVTTSFSKTFSMTGFRLGAVMAPEAVTNALVKLQSHLTGNVCTFAQFGGVAALALNKDELAQRRIQLEQKRDYAYDQVRNLFTCVRPQGAFYLFPDISGKTRAGETSEEFAMRLLDQTGVAVVPGSAFGMENHIRISYAVTDELLQLGLERIADLL